MQTANRFLDERSQILFGKHPPGAWAQDVEAVLGDEGPTSGPLEGGGDAPATSPFVSKDRNGRARLRRPAAIEPVVEVLRRPVAA
jgi:hypothetical protein